MSVSGTVTFNNVPIEKGTISFWPVDGLTASDPGEIVAGKFTLNVKPGEKKVQIRASRPLPPDKQDKSSMTLLYEDYIPPEFNSNTHLTATIGDAGATDLKFDLVPGKKP